MIHGQTFLTLKKMKNFVETNL